MGSRTAVAGLSVASLSLSERTLLWSMRVWVAGLVRPELAAADQMAAALADLRAAHATAYLDGFMWALRHGATRTIGIDCPCQPGLDADERALLDVFALAQHGGGMEAAMLLRAMVSPAASRAALDSAERLGRALAAAGAILVLPDRPSLAMFGLSAK